METDLLLMKMVVEELTQTNKNLLDCVRTLREIIFKEPVKYEFEELKPEPVEPFEVSNV